MWLPGQPFAMGAGVMRGPAAAPAWVPADVTGLVAVWDPTNGSGLVINDTFGGKTGTLGAGSETPTWVNDDPSLSFDGVDECVLAAGWMDLSTNDEITVAVVYMPTTDFGAVQMLLSQNTDNALGFDFEVGQRTDGKWQFAIGQGGAQGYVIQGSVTQVKDAWGSMVVSHAAGVQSMLANGDTQTTDNNSQSSLNYTASTVCKLGRGQGNVEKITGKVGVMLFYNVTKSLAEQKAIHDDIRAGFSGYSLPAAT